MSEPAAKPRPMIDLDEFERRLRRPAAGQPQSHEDPLAELARLVGSHDDPFKKVFEQEPQLPSARMKNVPLATPRVVHLEPEAEPDYQVSPDYTDEEPQLHGTIHPQAYAAPEAPMAARQQAYQQQAYQEAPHSEEDYAWTQQVAAPPPPPAAYVEAPRSRRPLYLTFAVVAVGIFGIGLAFAYKGRSSSHEVATIMAPTGPTKIQPDSPGGVDVPNQDASILDRSAQATPVGLANHQEQPVDLMHQPPRNVVADAAGSVGAAGVPVPPPPMGGSMGAQGGSYGIGAMIEPKKVKTVSVRSDGTLLPNDTPPAMPASAAPATAPHLAASPATAAPAITPKASTPKSTARVVTTPKPQSMDQLASDANANEATASDTAPTPIAPKPVAAKPKPVVVAAKPVKVAAAEATDTPAETSNAGAGGFAVQFSAPASEQEAHEQTAKLTQKFGSDLSGHHLTYHRATVGDKTVYRVRSGGLSRDEATSICEKVKANGGSCFVAKN